MISMKHAIISVVIITLSFLLYNGCTSRQTTHAQPIRFVVINSTSPSSPYEEFNPQLETTLLSINKENPVFTMHCGNIIHGGSSTMGINKIDVEKQYQQFYKYAKKLNNLLFTVCGPLDIYNQSTALYSKFTQKEAWYSFNYGTNHFIVLYSDSSTYLSLSDAQLSWLKDDLKKHSSSNIFVFSYFLPDIQRSKQFGSVLHHKLHELLSQYNVKAFFGTSGTTYTVTIDTIQYIPVPCDNNYANKYKKTIRYYVVDFDGQYITVVPRYF